MADSPAPALGGIPPLRTILILTGYMITSSSLLVINKVALVAFPYPAVVTALQYLATAVFAYAVLLSSKEGAKLDMAKFKAFILAALIFYLCIYANTMTLKGANVETVIVFRALVPLLAAIADRVTRKTPLPSLQGWAAIGLIIVGAAGYAATDSAFEASTYTWAVMYVGLMAVDAVYGKHLVGSLGLNTWGLMLYNNVGALGFFPVALVASGELSDVAEALKVVPAFWSVVLPVGMSCVAGCAISFFGFSSRTLVSATGFTVIGVLNKIFAVLLNVMVWDKHATAIGMFFISLSILGGVWFQVNAEIRGVESPAFPSCQQFVTDPYPLSPLAPAPSKQVVATPQAPPPPAKPAAAGDAAPAGSAAAAAAPASKA